MNARTQILRPAVGLVVAILGITGSSRNAGGQMKLAEPTLLADRTPGSSSNFTQVAAGDFNNDGIDDVIVWNTHEDNYVALGHALVPFQTRIPIHDLTSHPFEFDDRIEVGDLDRDSDLDVLLGGRPLLNDGTGVLTPVSSPFTTSGLLGPIRLADMNGDAHLDLVGANFAFALSTGPLTFGERITVPSMQKLPYFRLIALGMVSDDLYPEMLGTDAVLVSTTEPGAGTIYPLPHADSGEFVDLDDDGRAEIIQIAFPGSSNRYPNLRVFKFNGSGFDETQFLKIPIDLGWLLHQYARYLFQPLDIDADGDVDLAVTIARGDQPAGSAILDSGALVLTNGGDGTLAIGPSVSSSGLLPISMTAGNFDGAPGDDLVIANLGVRASNASGQNQFGRTVSFVRGNPQLSQIPQHLLHGSTVNSLMSGPAAIGDINEDGIPDFAGLQSGDPSVRLAIAPGVFDNIPVARPTSRSYRDVISADADGNGVPDVTYRTSSNSPSYEYFFRTEPNAFILPESAFVTGLFLTGLTSTRVFAVPGQSFFADLDNDGDEDTVTYTNSNLSINQATISVGLFDGAQHQTTTTVIPGRVRRLERIEVNGDSRPDIVVYKSADLRDPACTCWHDWRVEIYLNDGNGGFSASSMIALDHPADEITGMVVGDFAGDNRDDVVITTLGAEVRMFVQSDAGLGNALVRNTAPYSMIQPAVADFDLDGRLDIASPVFVDGSPVDPLFYDSRSLFLFGHRELGFVRDTRAAHFGGIPGFPSAADVNADGKPDYIMAGTYFGAAIYPNLTVPPPKCIADINADDLVDGRDLSVFLAQFGEAVTPGNGADFNSDGLVDGRDLSILLAQFGTACK